MTVRDQHEGFVKSYFGTMPSWAKTIVAVLTLGPLALAISGMLLNVNVGANIDKYLDIKFAGLTETQQATTGAVTDLNATVTTLLLNQGARLEDLEEDVFNLKTWACKHSDIQGLKADSPLFCE